MEDDDDLEQFCHPSDLVWVEEATEDPGKSANGKGKLLLPLHFSCSFLLSGISMLFRSFHSTACLYPIYTYIYSEMFPLFFCTYFNCLSCALQASVLPEALLIFIITHHYKTNGTTLGKSR